MSVDAVTIEAPAEPQAIGEESVHDRRDVDESFDSSAVARFVTFWIVGPTLATRLAHASFAFPRWSAEAAPDRSGGTREQRRRAAWRRPRYAERRGATRPKAAENETGETESC